jgi:hypothetical protein
VDTLAEHPLDQTDVVDVLVERGPAPEHDHGHERPGRRRLPGAGRSALSGVIHYETLAAWAVIRKTSPPPPANTSPRATQPHIRLPTLKAFLQIRTATST